ncbi:MAG TPA: pyridine nucleotide-disulfide oxidoreductase, partial [Actinomycetota bacterium]|nr:pyridine nucleotide-disulfide oxidoreductase [Actinomycetota bacterium]
VQLHGRAVGANGSIVRFEDQAELDVAGIVWATGFRVDHSWIDAPVFDDAGRVVHQRGVTEAPGLYFLGLSWQHTRGSALLGFVHEDAAFLADRIQAQHRATTSATVPATQEPSS